MKVPRFEEGEDPAAIVSFEMELMILPRLSGPHVPKFVAAGDWERQPYIVMEQIPGDTLYKRLPNCRYPMTRSPRSARKSPPRSRTCIASMSFIST